jgi:hypothetical protein
VKCHFMCRDGSQGTDRKNLLFYLKLLNGNVAQPIVGIAKNAFCGIECVLCEVVSIIFRTGDSISTAVTLPRILCLMSQCTKLHVAGWTWAVFTRVYLESCT